jgi:beta-lactam-binding protein with PASTA domain
MKKGKLRILTSKGESTRRSKILKDAKTMPLTKIKETLRARGLPVSSKREDIIRTIYADAMQAGMLSSG